MSKAICPEVLVIHTISKGDRVLSKVILVLGLPFLSTGAAFDTLTLLA